MTANQIFTIGHSVHSGEEFVALLQAHHIDVVVDVRSSPYSQYTPQHNREMMQESLGKAGIGYLYLGAELGARRDEEEAYDGDLARYELIRQLPGFNNGIERVREGMQKYRIALMCAEKDPCDCHRSVLVTRVFHEEGVEVAHILEDGSIDTQSDLERVMIDGRRSQGHQQLELGLGNSEEVISQAYRKRSEKICYRRALDESSNIDGGSS